jgi:MFS family permease
MSDGIDPKRALPVAAPDGLVAAVLLSFLSTAGLFYVNILPALVTGLVEGLGYPGETAGYVASANVYGASLGALVAVFTVKYLPWRKAAVLSLLLLMAIDLVSTQISDSSVLIPLRFLHGSVGGYLVGTGFSVIARTRSPDRTFGMLLVVQYGLGGLGLMLLPKLVPVFGPQVLFLALLAFSFVTLLMVPFIANYPPREHELQKTTGKGTILWKPLGFALVAVFLFQTSNMGIAAYIIELGKAYGLTTNGISTTLGIANWIAVFGAVLVYAVGTKFGRLKPLVAGALVTMAGMLLFHLSQNSWMFFAANVITGITWAYLIPYLLGMCSEFDAEGQMAALSGFFSKMGLASGPMIAALVASSEDYNLIINMAVVGMFMCLLAAFMPARLLDQQANTNSVSE